jgi:FixJ family two-component response regulator
MVFVVNDDPSTRRWIEATVMSAGLRALAFETRGELLSYVQPGTIACAILDVTLPDGSGFELQSDLARAGIASMFLTRDRCIASCVRAVKAGAVDFLTMPCDSISLVRALRDALRQSLSSRTQRVQSDALRSRYEQLTARERQVFALVSSGLRNKQVAHQLSISQITVQIHRGHVMKKMAARSFASLIRMADALQTGRTLPASDEAPDNSSKAGKPRATARRRTAISCQHELNSRS